MGIWQTIHLFDHKNFEQCIQNDLTNNSDEIQKIYESFMEMTSFYGEEGKYYSKIEKFDALPVVKEKFKKITNQIASKIKFSEINEIEFENQESQDISNLYDYNYARFINFLIFHKYSDYLPFAIAGKHGISSRYERNGCLGIELISKLERFSFFCHHYGGCMGIVNWLSVEEVYLLFLDLENLKQREDTFVKGFEELVKIAKDHQLGLIMGREMLNDDIYSKLPKSLNIDYDKYQRETLLFYQ